MLFGVLVPNELKQYTVLVTLFCFSNHTLCIHFCVLVHNKVKKCSRTHVFGNVLFLYIKCFSRVFVFQYLRSSETLITHVSGNTISFPNTEYFAYILAFYYERSSKTIKIHSFGTVCTLLTYQNYKMHAKSPLWWNKIIFAKTSIFSFFFYLVT